MANTPQTQRARNRLVLRRWKSGAAEYAGTRAQLIHAGLAQPGDFPGDPECACKVRHSFQREHQRIAIRVRSFIVDPRTYVLFTSSNTSAEPAKRRQRKRVAVAREAEKRVHEDHAEKVVDKYQVDLSNDDWPPHVAHNPAIQIGDGTRWHYLATPEALLLSGLLDAEEIPGNPGCKYRWRSLGWREEIPFQATRLGKRIAVTLLYRREEGPDHGTTIIRCVPLRFKPQ